MYDEAPKLERCQINDPKCMCWENDIFERKQQAAQLGKLISNTVGPYVIGLRSPWGSGKTFFLQAWRKELIQFGKPCIYFNAWEEDIANSPLLSLMTCIKEQTELPKWPERFSKIKSTILKCFNGVTSFIAALSPLIQLLGCGIGNIAISASSAYKNISDLIKNYNLAKRTFKNDIAALANEIAKETGGFPLLIMIDELDRCHPKYAIRLLEDIKHLFNVPHLVFIISFDYNQLLTQVEHEFGLINIDTEPNKDLRQEYLRKLIDLYYSLPDINKMLFVKHELHHIHILRKMSKTFMEECKISCDVEDILASDAYLFENQSLRSIAQKIEQFSVFLRCYPDSTCEAVIATFVIIFLNKDAQYNGQDNSFKEYVDFIENTLLPAQKDHLPNYIERISINLYPYINYIFLLLRISRTRVEHAQQCNGTPDESIYIKMGYLWQKLVEKQYNTNFPIEDMSSFSDIRNDIENKLKLLQPFSSQ